MDALGALGFALLVAHVAAHVAVALAVARANKARGALAFVVPPLGVVWGWDLGAKRRVIVWAGTLAAFALVVAVIQAVR